MANDHLGSWPPVWHGLLDHLGTWPTGRMRYNVSSSAHDLLVTWQPVWHWPLLKYTTWSFGHLGTRSACATILVWHMIFLASGQQGACAISLEWHMVFWAPGHQVSLCHHSSLAHEHFSIWPPVRKGYFSTCSMSHDLLGTWPTERMCHFSRMANDVLIPGPPVCHGPFL
jgi:hypothetical protein